MQNILFSTTRGWNPGDDFILYGIRNLLADAGASFNALVYNRNPDLHYPRMKGGGLIVNVNGQNREVDLTPHIENITWRSDNSWRQNMAFDYIDYVIFAGTPEWLGDMNLPMSSQILKHSIPHSYMGIGAFENYHLLEFEKFYKEDRLLLENAELITVRDEISHKLLSHLSPVSLPCPSLFSARTTRRVKKMKRVAVNIQHPSGRQPLRDSKLFDYIKSIVAEISKHMDCTGVVHYIDELDLLRELDIPLLYSYDPVDYFNIYSEFDFLITTRVHACGICASLGIPSMFFDHTDRASTVDGFLSERTNYMNTGFSNTAEVILSLPVADISEKLHAHKTDTHARYMDVINTTKIIS